MRVSQPLEKQGDEMMKRIMVFVLVLVLTLLVAIPVYAAPPTVETGAGEVNVLKFPSLCQGFEVWDHMVYSYRTTNYFNNDGTLTKSTTHYVGTDELYNPANPGVVLNDKFNVTVRYDAVKNQWSGSGIDFHVNVPGYGALLMLAGRWLNLDPDGNLIHLNGKDSFANPADIAKFCSCLAGN